MCGFMHGVRRKKDFSYAFTYRGHAIRYVIRLLLVPSCFAWGWGKAFAGKHFDDAQIPLLSITWARIRRLGIGIMRMF